MDMPFKKTSLKKKLRKKNFKKILKNTSSRFKKISLHIHKKRTSILNYLVIFLMIGFGFMVVFKTVTALLSAFDDFKPTDIVVKVIGKKLPKDKNGYTNILILGEGGQTHQGGDLTDTIIVASINKKKPDVVMLSIPRDFWLKTDITESRVNEIVRDAKLYNERQGLEPDDAWNKGLKVLEEKLEEVLDVEIHRYVKIDFIGFEKLIDAIGGVDVVVDRTINDPSYPDGNWGYERFFLKEGPQHLDGLTALKFARSRHDSSDFDRAARQQKILEAFRQKALSLGVLTSPTKIGDILTVIKENFQTDFEFKELVTLAGIGTKMDRNNVISRVLHDDPTRNGGFLVTPSRELYGGAFVLVPWLNMDVNYQFEQIQAYSDLVFEERFLSFDPPKIEIENATYVQGLAGSLKMSLDRYNVPVFEIGTADEKSKITKITYLDNSKNKKTIAILKRLFQFQEEPLIEGEDRLLITIGSDYQKPYRIPEEE
jgi:LCP family protein required for cell wall assembly